MFEPKVEYNDWISPKQATASQIRYLTTEDSESRQQIRYLHCYQIGIQRGMTDKDGNLL